MTNPSTARWHDGEGVLDSAQVVDALVGRAAVEEMSSQAVKSSRGARDVVGQLEGLVAVRVRLCGVKDGTLVERKTLAPPKTLVFECSWK